MNETVEQKQAWGFWPTIWLTLLVVAVFVIVQTAVGIVFVKLLRVSPSIYLMESNGLYLSSATIATTLTVVPFVFFLAKFRRIPPEEYFCLNFPGLQQCLQWIAALLVLAFFSDRLSIMLCKPIVPDFMLNVYTTCYSIPLLLIGVAMAAPVTEEIIFRGFLLRGIENSRVGGIGAIVISSLWWAFLHMQYDLYGIGTVFVMGLVLGAARVKTRSIYLPIAMHSLWSLVSTVEVVFYAGHIR